MILAFTQELTSTQTFQIVGISLGLVGWLAMILNALWQKFNKEPVNEQEEKRRDEQRNERSAFFAKAAGLIVIFGLGGLGIYEGFQSLGEGKTGTGFATLAIGAVLLLVGWKSAGTKLT
ncbi:MAG: hypothetical protein HY286_00920 [Planctomycetes bacterium]|nr:hypothetical protein [Planctomycetota bacterium]